MPLPRSIVVYPAGTDTRAQFTTPPDARQVADLVAAHEDPIVGGTVAGSYTHNSTGNWVRVAFASGNRITDDGNLDTTYDCWKPPSGHFDDYTTVFVDVVFSVEFYDNGASAYTGAVQAATRASLGAGSVASEYNGFFRYNASDDFTFGTAMTASGCIPGIPLTTGQTVELRTFQNTGGNQTHAYRWGVRLHGGA